MRKRIAGLVSLLSAALLGCQEVLLDDVFFQDEIVVRDDLYAIASIGEDKAWAAGYFGAVYHTNDGGDSWARLDTGTRKSLYDISFADENHGWAVGRRGFIVHTSDGGQSWERQRSPRFPPRHLFSVHAVDAQNAWVVGDWGSRYRTRDGGKTWEDVSFLVDREHRAFPYLTEEELERFERGDKVYDDIYLNDIYFRDAQHGWIAAEYGQIFYTEDGGETWQVAAIQGDVSFEDVPFQPGSSEIGRELWDTLFEAAEQLNEKIYLRLGVEGFLTAAELDKSGETLVADERTEAVADFLEGEGVTQDRIKQWNKTPFDTTTVDMDEFQAGKVADTPHVKLSVIETPFIFDVKFRDEQHGIAAGLGGVILMTEDGGKTWTYRDSRSTQGLFAADFSDRALFAVGTRGLHRRSTDGGRTWEQPEPAFQESYEFFGFMRDMSCAGLRCWIVGQSGFVLRSDDGAMSWTQMDLTHPRRIAGETPQTASGE